MWPPPNRSTRGLDQAAWGPINAGRTVSMSVHFTRGSFTRVFYPRNNHAQQGVVKSPSSNAPFDEPLSGLSIRLRDTLSLDRSLRDKRSVETPVTMEEVAIAYAPPTFDLVSMEEDCSPSPPRSSGLDASSCRQLYRLCVVLSDSNGQTTLEPASPEQTESLSRLLATNGVPDSPAFSVEPGDKSWSDASAGRGGSGGGGHSSGSSSGQLAKAANYKAGGPCDHCFVAGAFL